MESFQDPKATNSALQYPTRPRATCPSKRATRNKAVRDAVEARDWGKLASISSQPGGFQGARTVAWPFLLHAIPSTAVQDIESKEGNEKSYESCICALPRCQQFKERRRKQLTDVILGVLREHPQLSYFQGYHDIISTLQLTLHPSLDTDEEALRVLRACATKISLHRARDAMGAGLEPLTGQLRILRRLLRISDPELAILIEESTANPLPYWAISPLMTLYTHDLPTLELAQRVMDWILCRPPDAVIYLVAAFVLEKKAGVKKLIEEGDDGMMHSFLSNLPELEADELEFEDEDTRTEGTATPPGRAPGSVVEGETSSIAPPLTEDSSAVGSLSEAATPSGRSSPTSGAIYSNDLRDSTDFGQDNITDSEKSRIDALAIRSPPSPALSTSSLPPPIAPSNNTTESAVPLSGILQKADKLRDKYPISLEALRLDATIGSRSMLRTWSTDPQQILGDAAAEEAVLDTTEVVLPDLDDDVFEPYPPPEPEPEAAKGRLVALPKLDLATVLSIGIPMVAIAFTVASNSPTTRAHAAQAFAFTWSLVEVGGGMV
ncbi:Rab-GTPase-TBC domain protein [Ceratobasidium sp. AG-Ba]|nr:Rab-GTPase-TBC domain protein [Ceratobasidium sp. AG-Ba]